jgi:hypothetical protein
MGLEPKDKLAICLKVMPLLPTQDGRPEWVFTAVTYQGFESGYLIVDTSSGREAIAIDEILRICKVSDIAVVQPKIVAPR